MNKYILFLFCLISLPAAAQVELSSYAAAGRGGIGATFATDYHAIGVNPANLGFRKSFRDPVLTVGALEFGATFSSDVMSRNELFTTLFDATGFNFTQAEKQEVASRFSRANLNATIEANLIGVAVSLPKIGGFAFSIRDRIQFHAQLNPTIANIMFLGYNADYFDLLYRSNGSTIKNSPNLSDDERDQIVRGERTVPQRYGEIMDGAGIKMSWWREFNLAYGRRILDRYNLSVHLGGGVRFIQGIALINMSAQNGVLQESNLSLSETFGLDLSNSEDSVRSPTFRNADPNASTLQKVLLPSSVGNGFGMDLGINLIIRRNLHIGLSAINIGNMNWEGNVAQLNDGTLEQIEGSGFNTFNILVNDPNALKFAGDKAPLKWTGSQGKIVRALPLIYRFGVSYEYFKTFHVGGEVMVPGNTSAGNLAQTYIALGGDWQINRWFRVSSGVNFGGNNGTYINVPAGVIFTPARKLYEIGVSTLDFRSYLLNSTAGTNLSMMFGFKVKPF